MKFKAHVFLVLAILLGIITAPAFGAAQTGSQPYFYGEEPWGGSYLGIETDDITPDRLGPLHLKEETGVEVTMVDQDAPAAKAGLKEHDVILSINDQKVESVEELRRLIREIPPGRTVNIGISRDGQPMTLKAVLAKMPDMNININPAINIPAIHIPPINMPEIDVPTIVVIHSPRSSGLMIENLTPQLGAYFGVKGGNGVLVRSVEKGSRADKAGFHAGDVIVKVNGQQIHDTSDFQHAVKSRNGDSVNVGVMRDRKEQNMTLSLPEKKDSGSLFEEDSFDSEPLIRAESALQFSKLQDELAKLRPEMELAAENSRKAAEELRRDMCKQQSELQRQAQRQRERAEKDLEKLRRQLQMMREDWL
jgi:serine protease Do